MLLNIDPTYMKHQKPDVSYTKNSYSFLCYDLPNSTLLFTSSVGFLNPRSIFEKSVFTICSNFWDEIRDQVHIFPGMYVDFGLVLSQREVPYYIWNSYTNKSVYVEEPVSVGDYGTTFVIDIAGNFTLQPGKGTPAILTVYVEGPVSSGTDFHISVTPQGLSEIEYVLKTIATRVVVFPFWADWSKKVEFGLKFETVISKSTQNLEQRRPLMEKPQRSISFTNLDTTFGLITNSINFAQDKSIGIPLVHELFQVSSVDPDKMSFTIRENTSELWNLKRYCNYVLLFDVSTRVLIAKKITSMTANKIYIENPILETINNVASIVGFPMIIGVFKSAKPTVMNGNYVSWDLKLEELIGDNQPALTGVPAMVSQLTNKFDWSEKVGFEQEIYRDLGEFIGTAQMVYPKYPLNKNSNKPYTGTFKFKTRAEMFSFLDFVCSAKGRFRKFEFLIPINEFQVVQGEFEGTNTLRVKNNFYAEQFSKVQNKKVVIYYRNFTLNTSISSVSTNSSYTSLSLTNSTNFRIFDEDCHNVRIEQWKTLRMDLDEFSFKCNSGKHFELDIRFMEVYE
jgi:hypothetical protein